MRTTLQAPNEELLERAADCARRYRRGDYGDLPHRNHYNAVFLTLDDPSPIYRIDVWGERDGHVRSFAYDLRAVGS